MVLYQIEWARILQIFIVQPVASILFIALAIKILLRKRDQVSLSIASFYIISSFTFIINIIYVVLSTFIEFYFLLFFLYFLTAFFLMLSFIFIINFLTLLLNVEKRFTSGRNIAILIIYGFLCFLILLYPEGITLKPAESWRPVYSPIFSIIIYVFFTLIIFIPTIYLSIKLYRRFESKNLKKKLKILIIGIIEMLTIFYGTILFNTTYDHIIRAVWGVTSIFILFSSAFFIYLGIGQKI